MSQYCECKPGFTQPDSVVKALIAIGYSLDQIEIHKESQNLYGYRGDKRPQRAHIIIRRKYIDSAANDVGFEIQSDGSIVALISQYDRGVKFNDTVLNRLKQEYAVDVLQRTHGARGRTVEVRRLPAGDVDVQIRGYR
jgi:hypothetical protein